MATTRTTIYLSETDRHILATLQDQYGVTTRSAALRYAIRTGAERQEQQPFLTEQLTMLRGELRQAHEASAALKQERQEVDTERHHLSAAAAAPPLSASERSLRRQQSAHARETAQRMCLHAKQVREPLLQQRQRWHTTVERLRVEVRSIVLQSRVLIQTPTAAAEEAP